MARLLSQLTHFSKHQFTNTSIIKDSSRFINTTRQTLQRTLSNKIIIRNNDETHVSPLVLLFGWGNGKLDHLVKYSEIFEQRNFTTVCIKTSLVNSLLRTSTVGRKESQDVQQVLDDLLKLNPDRPVILYPFSNGGCAIYHLLSENYSSLCQPGRNVKGIIFDSCPVVPNEKSAEAVQKAFSLNQNIFVRKLLGPLVKTLVLQITLKDKDVQTFMEKMEQSQLNSPQLFLCSKADELAPYEDILDFIEKRKTLGVDVHYKLWDSSPHVGHMREYKEDYITTVNNFIDKCLE